MGVTGDETQVIRIMHQMFLPAEPFHQSLKHVPFNMSTLEYIWITLTCYNRVAISITPLNFI